MIYQTHNNRHLLRNNSKGNQLKWREGEFWYKADYLGYEALSETLISCLLKKSNVSLFTEYQMEELDFQEKKLVCCKSAHFLTEDESLISLPKLFRQFQNVEIAEEIENPLLDEEECIRFLVDEVESITGIRHFGDYFTQMLEIDAFFLNEDRHLKNIAVIYDNKKDSFRLCPYFDFGASLFSDTTISYEPHVPISDCYKKITAKPISPDFSDQIFACKKLYGPQLKFYFTQKDIEDIMLELSSYYTQNILDRVKKILSIQQEKYIDLFPNQMNQQISLR